MAIETFLNCVISYLVVVKEYGTKTVEFCFAVLVYVVDWLYELVFLLLVEIRVVNIGVLLVLASVHIACPTVRKRPPTDCRPTKRRVCGQTPAGTCTDARFPARIRPKGESSDKRLANRILIDKSHGKSLLVTLAKLRESIPYVKIYRYNPKHLYPKLNCYGDNGQRSLKV